MSDDQNELPMYLPTVGEIGFLRDVLPEAEVERTHHMMAGAHICGYSVRPRTSPPAAGSPATVTGDSARRTTTGATRPTRH